MLEAGMKGHLRISCKIFFVVIEYIAPNGALLIVKSVINSNVGMAGVNGDK